jgi:hypothetical protein
MEKDFGKFIRSSNFKFEIDEKRFSQQNDVSSIDMADRVSTQAHSISTVLIDSKPNISLTQRPRKNKN